MELKNKLIKNILNTLIVIVLMVFNFNIYAGDNFAPYFYETPTRFIVVVSCVDAQCKKTNTDGYNKNVYYYEINKNTGKGLKLKGEIMKNSSGVFQGHEFYNKNKNLIYTIYFSSGEFLIDKISYTGDFINYHSILAEHVINYSCHILSGGD